MREVRENRTEERILLMSEGDVFRGSLILVNREHGLKREGRRQRLLPVSGIPGVPGGFGNADPARDPMEPCIYMEERAAGALRRLMDCVCRYGEIVCVSGYRSGEEQEALYADSVKENGEAFTRKYVAVPGHSEHETGLAIDVGRGGGEIDFIRPDFPYEGICQRFRRQAPHYGFVERYPRGREAVTGIGHEPWHFRYVGEPHARIMTEKGLTLEEYHELLRRDTTLDCPLVYRCRGGEAHVSFVRASSEGRTEIPLKGDDPVQVLGNNVDGFVVTVWRSGI